MKQLFLLLLVLSVNLLVIMQCGGSEVWGLQGTVVDGNGNTVANATVKLYSNTGEILGDAPSFETTTDKAGVYAFTSKEILSGSYVVQGTDSISGSVTEFLRRNVEFDSKNGYLDLKYDTLKHPGSLRVIIRNATGKFDGKTGYLPGTPYLNIADNDTLKLSNVARGKYICRFENVEGFSRVETDSFQISPDSLTVIVIDVEIDPDGNPPEPDSVTVVGIIDTALGKAVLKWNPVKVKDLNTYVVYRGINPNALELLHTTANTVDTVDLIVDTSGTVVANYFQVEAKDNGTNESSSDTIIRIDAPSPKILKTQISATLFQPHSTLFIGDTARIIVTIENKGRVIDSVTWALGKSDSIVKTVRLSDTTHMCRDTMIMVWKDSLVKTWYITAYDNSGSNDTIVKSVTGSGMYAPNTWQIFQAPNPKVKQTLTAVSDGKKIYFMGGFIDKISDDPRQPPQMVGSDTITFFSPDSFDGYRYAKMISKRYYHSSVFYNGKIYSIGGMGIRGSFSTIEMFDPVTNQSVIVDTLPFIRYLASIAVYGSNFIITGGVNFPHPDSSEGFITGTIEKYDISLLAKGREPLSTLGTMYHARKCHSTVVCGSELVIMGGIDSVDASAAIDAVESIDLETKEQVVLTSMKDSRCFFTAVAISDKVYVFGGRGSGTILNSVETFDTKKRTGWKIVSEMKTPRYYMAATVHNNKVYLAGGISVNSNGRAELDSTISIYYP